MKITYIISGMTCNGCVSSVKEKLSKVDGVVSVSINLEANEAIVDSLKAIAIPNLEKVLHPKYKIEKKHKLDSIKSVAILEEKNKFQQLKPLFLIFGYITVAAILLNYKEGNLQGVMLDFMGLFYIVFSFFKFLDLKGFPESFKMYDPLAKVLPFYALVYPFIEAALGLLFLMRLQIPLALGITIVILGLTTVGVTKALLDKKSIQCACLGTALKLPMTQATFIENTIMLVMAIGMLIQRYI